MPAKTAGAAETTGPAGSATPGRTRLSAAERRAQLTEIGLELLADQPIHELALDEVADKAGISRTLVFHYFPTKSDFYAAVVERAGQRLLAGGKAPTGAPGPERVHSLISGYLRLVESSRDLYVRLVRGAAGGDPAVIRTIDDLRTALIPTWVVAAGAPGESAADPLTALLVRGWLVGLEEVALAWDPTAVAHEELADALTASFLALIATLAPSTD
ncbi:MAG: TetR/AcrR family transcriptional regulator [Actinobacteria bacterium]|nr:TetR/AcrR family transcriptional regulator [Actinomycetota bacterium]